MDLPRRESESYDVPSREMTCRVPTLYDFGKIAQAHKGNVPGSVYASRIRGRAGNTVVGAGKGGECV